MAESVTLLPAPFFAPVPTGTGSLLTFGPRVKRPLLLKQLTRTSAPELDEGTAYDRDGRFIADPPIGTRVNIYI